MTRSPKIENVFELGGKAIKISQWERENSAVIVKNGLWGDFESWRFLKFDVLNSLGLEQARNRQTLERSSHGHCFRHIFFMETAWLIHNFLIDFASVTIFPSFLIITFYCFINFVICLVLFSLYFVWVILFIFFFTYVYLCKLSLWILR